MDGFLAIRSKHCVEAAGKAAVVEVADPQRVLAEAVVSRGGLQRSARPGFRLEDPS